MATYTLPTLPEGFTWNVDVHRNPIIGERLAALKVIKPTLINILGIKFTYRKQVASSVTFADQKDIDIETAYLLAQVNQYITAKANK